MSALDKLRTLAESYNGGSWVCAPLITYGDAREIVAEVERLRGILDMGGTGDEARAAAAAAEEQRISEGLALRTEIERLRAALERIYQETGDVMAEEMARASLAAQSPADKETP